MSQTNERHILGLSGGKDSSALALFMKNNHPEIKMEYFFTDTGSELPETYSFLDKMENKLGQEIVRLKSQGRTFEQWLEIYNNFLPSFRSRWCTRQLKIQAFEEWLSETTSPDTDVYSYVGIRWDERERDGYKPGKNGLLVGDKMNRKSIKVTPVFPFIQNKIGKPEMLKILEDCGVCLPDYYKWRSRSGCYFCFFQTKNEWVGLLKNHPELFEKAKEIEQSANYQWRSDASLSQIEADADNIQARYEKRLRVVEEKKKQLTLFDIDMLLRGEDPLEGLGLISGQERLSYNEQFEDEDGLEEKVCLDCHL